MPKREHLLDRHLGVLGEDVAERLLVHELHRDVGRVAVAADVENGHDVGVRDGAGGARLAQEAGDIFLVDAELVLEQLDRDRAVDVGVAGAIDARHRPFADELGDFVAADFIQARLCRCQCHSPISIVRYGPPVERFG